MKCLILLLLFFGCSSTTTQNNKIFKIEDHALSLPENYFDDLSKTMTDEINYIQKIEPTDFRKELIDTLKVVSQIDFQSENCSQGQVACAFKNYPHTIFINQHFLKLTRLEQFTSLLHEARHLEKNHFEHVKCSKKPQWGYECDEDLDSAYGLEYKYSLHKYINTKDEQSAQLLQRIFNRINKI